MRYDILGEAISNQIILKFYPLNDDIKQQITRLGYKALLELTLKVSEKQQKFAYSVISESSHNLNKL